MSEKHHRPVEILLVEDNPADVRLAREALKEGMVSHHLRVAADGIEALAILCRTGSYLDEPLPDIILLDLNLPRMSGWEVLAKIKVAEKLRRIPVVVLSTSAAEDDVCQAYRLHANCYIPKPVELEAFIRVVKAIDSFWFTFVRLPGSGN